MLKRKSGRQLYGRASKPHEVTGVNLSGDLDLLAEINRQFSVDQDLKVSTRNVIGLLQRKGVVHDASVRIRSGYDSLYSKAFLKQLQPFTYWLLHLSGICAFSDYLQHMYTNDDKAVYLFFIDTIKNAFSVAPGNDERQRIMYDLYTDIIRYVFLMSVYGTTSDDRNNSTNKEDATTMSTYVDFSVPVDCKSGHASREKDVVFGAQLDENVPNNTLSTLTSAQSLHKNSNISDNMNIIDERTQELHHHVLRDIVRPAGGATLSVRDVACYRNVLRLCALWTAPDRETSSNAQQSRPLAYATVGDDEDQNQLEYQDKASLVLQNLEVSSLCHILSTFIDSNDNNRNTATQAEVEHLLRHTRSAIKHTVFNRVLSPQLHFIDGNSDFAFIMNECRYSTRGHSVLFYLLANLLESSDGEGDDDGRNLITTHPSNHTEDGDISQLFVLMQRCASACEQNIAGLYNSGITRTIAITLLLTSVYNDRCILRDAISDMVDLPAQNGISFDNWLMRLIRIVVTAKHEALSLDTLSSHSTGWNNVQVVPSKEHSCLLFAVSPLVPYLAEESVRLLQKVGKRIKQNIPALNTHTIVQQPSGTNGNSSNSSISLHMSCKAACDALLDSCKKKMVQIEKARDPVKFLTYMNTFRSTQSSTGTRADIGNKGHHGDGDSSSSSSSSMLTEANLATLSQYIPVWASTYKSLGSLPAQVAAQCRMYGAGKGHRILMDAMTQCIGRNTNSTAMAVEVDGNEVPSKVTTAMVRDVVVGMTRGGPNGAPLCPQEEGLLFLSTIGPRAKGKGEATAQASKNDEASSHVSHCVTTLLDHLPLRPQVKTCLTRSLVVMRQAIQLVGKGYTVGRREVLPVSKSGTVRPTTTNVVSTKSLVAIPVGGTGTLGSFGALNVGGSHENMLAAEMLPVWEDGIMQSLAIVQEAHEHASGSSDDSELLGMSSVIGSSLAQLAREITGAISKQSSTCGSGVNQHDSSGSNGDIDGAFCKHWLFFLSQAILPLSAHPQLQAAFFEALFPVTVRDNASNSNSNISRCAMTQTGGLVMIVMEGEMYRGMVKRLLFGNAGTSNSDGTGRGGTYLSLLRQMTFHDVLQSCLLWISSLYSFTDNTVITDHDRQLVLEQRLQQCPAYLCLLVDYLSLHTVISQYDSGHGVPFVDICCGWGHEDVMMDVANLHTIRDCDANHASNGDRWLDLLPKASLRRALTLLSACHREVSGTSSTSIDIHGGALGMDRGDRRQILREILRLQHALEPIAETVEKEGQSFFFALYEHAATVLPGFSFDKQSPPSTRTHHSRASSIPSPPQSLSGVINHLYSDLQPHKAGADPSDDDFGAGEGTSASDRALECVENRFGEVIGSLYGEVPAYCVSVMGRVNLSTKPPSATNGSTSTNRTTSSNESFDYCSGLHANRLLMSLMRAHRYIAPDVLLDMWAVLGDTDMAVLEHHTGIFTTRELLKDVYVSMLSVHDSKHGTFSLQDLATLLDFITAQMWCKGERDAAFAFVRGMALLESIRECCADTDDIAGEVHRGMLWLVGIRPNIAAMCGYPPVSLLFSPVPPKVERTIVDRSILLIADVALIAHQVTLFDIVTTASTSNSDNGDMEGWTATSLDASHTYLAHLLRTSSTTLIPRASVVAYIGMTFVHAILYDIAIYEKAFYNAVPVFKKGGRVKGSGVDIDEAISIDMSQSDSNSSLSSGSKRSKDAHGKSSYGEDSKESVFIDLDAEENVVQHTRSLLLCWLHGLRLWLTSCPSVKGDEVPQLWEQIHGLVSDALWSLPALLVAMRLSAEQVNAIVNYVTGDRFRQLYVGLEERQYTYLHPFNANLDQSVDVGDDNTNHHHCQALHSLLAGCLFYSITSLDTRTRGVSSPLSKRRKGSGSSREVLRNEREAALVMKTHVYMALRKYANNDGGSIGGDNKNEEQIINGHILQNLRGRGLPNGVVQQCMENL